MGTRVPIYFPHFCEAMKTQEKLVALLHRLTNTCDPRTPESFFIGGVRLFDMPQDVDEFMRLWLTEYDKRMRRFRILRPLIEWRYIKDRFVTYEEYQTVFNGGITKTLNEKNSNRSGSLDEIYVRYPMYRLAQISSEQSRQQFIMNYHDTLTSYFVFMKKKNPGLHRIFHKWHRIAVPKEKRIHTWITGTTGIGKSELMKSMILQDIRQKLKQDCTIVVIDPNGDFVKEIAQFKENYQPEYRDKLSYIDMDLFRGEYTPVINPFQLTSYTKRDREIDLTNQQISKALEEIFDSVGQPLTSQQQTILYNCLQVLLEKEGSTLWELQDFVAPGKMNPLSIPYVELGKQSTNPATRSFFKHIFDQNSEYGVSKSGIYTKAQRLLNMPSFSNLITGKSTIDLKEAFDSNKLLLINLAIGNLGDQAPIFIGKIIVSLIQSIVFRRAEQEKKDRKPVYLYIDEFQDFINPSLMRILTQGRKYKIYLTVANQFVGQGMTSEELEGILGTTKIKIMGHNSVKSLSSLSKETDAEIEYLKKLTVGEFMVKIGEANPFILHPSIESLESKNSMMMPQWNEIVAEQKVKHYRKRPIDDILKQMMEREEGPEHLYKNPPTDHNVKTPPKNKPKQKPRFNALFNEHEHDKPDP